MLRRQPQRTSIGMVGAAERLHASTATTASSRKGDPINFRRRLYVACHARDSRTRQPSTTSNAAGRAGRTAECRRESIRVATSDRLEACTSRWARALLRRHLTPGGTLAIGWLIVPGPAAWIVGFPVTLAV
jgi:hypothetical protein